MSLSNKILFAFGTRPEAIKLAPVIEELGRDPKRFKICVVVTAQHRFLLDQVLNLFHIKPDYDLGVMRENQGLSEVLIKCMVRLQPVLKKEKPDLVLVQGDATSAFASALAAYYQKIPVGHIEAGLRTFDKFAPFPEEINRRLITTIADWHFAPTERAKINLLNEGIAESKIFVTGNTVIDALLKIRRKLKKRNFKKEKNKRLLLVTIHRRESFGEPLRRICQALIQLARRSSDVEIVYPVHPNPNVRNTVRNLLDNIKNVHLIPPVDYLHFIQLLEEAFLVLTDSGGVQEEAPTFGKPVLVLREKTERPELISAGCGVVVGTDPKKIIEVTEMLLRSSKRYQEMANAVNPFGDGKAAKRIRRILTRLL